MESLVFAMNADNTVIDHARALLGTRLVGHDASVVITEVEAYAGVDDPASHAFTRTKRSEIMYGEPWRLYVYRIHTHFCANIVTGPTEQAAAVLIRAGRVVDGVRVAQERRGSVDDVQLARGPGNLTKALGINLDDLGTDLHDPTPVYLDAGVESIPDAGISAGPRVGVRLAAQRPWRFWITDDPTVSAYRRHPKA
ncbi:DNA-3-methyladenine glycosylase [Gordonia sp. TBRC 11910]|uniref:Putative 3-methyladenine DNA glycosylase n=1 Tax=Gordonia asplenii TaxID=2725283 RepID=A0A848KXL6_9ACTN|nr:DNA-3-methyladenine glycosylase [Gordonia asplenii]NMO01595.1 DNA-3-methyladenine glycosylase [Gordonia asplenii]